jgi:hypothetical protein
MVPEPLIEVLTFEGCPHAAPALVLVNRVVAESGLDATVRRIDIPNAEDAITYRFLGSPTIRVDGLDIEPGADHRTSYVLSCRVYRTSAGVGGVPDEAWLREALARD